MVAHRPEVSGCTRRRLLSAGSSPEYFLGGRGKFVSGYIASPRPAWATVALSPNQTITSLKTTCVCGVLNVC